MKKLAILLAASAVFTVGACAQGDEAADSAAVGNDTAGTGGAESSQGAAAAAPAPMVTETTVIREADASSTADATDDSVTIGPDGISANIGDGDTRVRADVDEDPSMTVTDR